MYRICSNNESQKAFESFNILSKAVLSLFVDKGSMKHGWMDLLSITFKVDQSNFFNFS